MNEDPSERRIEDLLSGLPNAERNELRRTWNIVAAADEEMLNPSELSSAFEKVRGRTKGKWSARVVLLRTAGLAAALVAGIFLGRAYFDSSDSAFPTTASSQEGRYLILIRNDTDPAESPPRHDAVEEFQQWAMELAVDGRLVDAAELRDGGLVLSRGGDQVNSVELSMSDQRASGYFLIHATSREEAEAIARHCPHLRHGGTIEIREIVTS